MTNGNDWYDDLEDDSGDKEFNPCSRCDLHPACEDFGCAYLIGLFLKVKKVKKEITDDFEDWD